MKEWLKDKKTVSALVALVLCIVGVVIVKKCRKEDDGVLPMEKTMASIEEVKLRGEIYVCSAMIEDYTMLQATERNLIFPNEEHSCVQTMRQKCSYKIDLDKVEYLPDDSARVVLVKLPKVEYVASTQSSSFLSDDGNFWAEHLPNTNEMKRKVERQIKERFDTPNNRRKAERYAEDAISEVMGKLGYEVEFVGVLEKRKE
ncbi:MAG: hypothetical protein IJ693_04575 [Bacteroidaceae bacterium]|nr:hypothetical protein [Bacteroidaceae bacterium]